MNQIDTEYDYYKRTLSGKPLWEFNKDIDRWELTTEGKIVEADEDIKYMRCPSCPCRIGSHALKESRECLLIGKDEYKKLIKEF